MRLGCNITPRERLATVPYLAAHCALPILADTCDFAKRMVEPWGMMANDQYGNCVFAGFGHLVQGQSVNARGVARTIPDATLLGWYGDVTGFDPKKPSTDNGTVPLDALKCLTRKGEIVAYGRVDPDNDAHVVAALQLFGGLYASYALPLAWQGQDTWGIGQDTRGNWEPYSWGGHMVNHVGHDRRCDLDTITWGRRVTVTNAARRTYCRELYAVITEDWLQANGASIQGFDLAGLIERLELVD
jgi:hypothetical protein